MQANLYNWAGSAKNLPIWFIHDTTIDITLEQIKELYDTGNNVMLCHVKNMMVIFVDDRRFSQR